MSTIKLGTNTASLMAQRRLAEGTNALARTYERLSSGQRINRASDDAAGLAIADSLRAGSRIFNQGVRNLNDGVSLLNIADSSVENLAGIIIRLEELAEQASNGTYGVQQRKALDAEAQALGKEYSRISKTTKFNGIDLLGGSLDQINLQAGFGANSVLSAGVGGDIGTGTFNARVSYAAGFGTFSVATGDFNGDGALDLVTTDYSYGGSSLSVLLGRGNGSFGARLSYPTVFNPLAVATGDLNGDGMLDLVTSASYGNTVRIGRGDGTFGSGTVYEGENYNLSLGDLNGDGVLDLVTGNSFLGSSVRLGRGDGSFGSAASYAGDSNCLALGDLNGDGALDLVVGGGYGPGNEITIRLGSGNGSFGNANYFSTNYSTRSIALGDVNGDGKLDLAASGEGPTIVAFGLGNGTFGASTCYATTSEAYSFSVALSDLNGDGVLDMLMADDDSFANVWLGTASGTFGATFSYFTGMSPRSIATGDFSGDGVLDFVTADYGGNSISVLLAKTKDGVAPLLPFSLKTLADARQALPVFKNKRDQLAAQRGEIGAFQSRISVASNVLQVTSENFRAAESRIRDADLAQESADLVRLNILQQAASSILAQANQQPALAIRLLSAE